MGRLLFAVNGAIETNARNSYICKMAMRLEKRGLYQYNKQQRKKNGSHTSHSKLTTNAFFIELRTLHQRCGLLTWSVHEYVDSLM